MRASSAPVLPGAEHFRKVHPSMRRGLIVLLSALAGVAALWAVGLAIYTGTRLGEGLSSSLGLARVEAQPVAGTPAYRLPAWRSYSTSEPDTPTKTEVPPSPTVTTTPSISPTRTLV